MGFYFNFIIENLFIQGQVENWITIIDLDKVSLMSAGSVQLLLSLDHEKHYQFSVQYFEVLSQK